MKKTRKPKLKAYRIRFINDTFITILASSYEEIFDKYGYDIGVDELSGEMAAIVFSNFQDDED